jgi:hypothetical protein
MYLFFVRHFNDIDHLTPIAWKLHKESLQVAVLCMNMQYDIRQDYRLTFLKNQGVTVASLYTAFNRKRDPIHQILYWLICGSYYIERKLALNDERPWSKLSMLLGKLANRAGSKFYDIVRKRYYHQGWARSILELTNTQAVCFDHVMPKLFVVDAFLKAAKELSIPAVALPHGVHMYTKEVSNPDLTETRRFAKFNRFDYIVVANTLRKDVLVKVGIPEGKISVLGAARYCRAWLEQNDKIVPKLTDNLSKNPEKLKVVLMPSNLQHWMDLERMFASCQLIAGLNGIEAVIKPHTRMSKKDQFGNYPLPDVSHMLTADLCAWADVLLIVGSSVMCEALMREKTVLYIKYLHKNTPLFAEMNACWIIHDETELKRALLSLQADRSRIPYSKESVAAFLSEVVYGGYSNRDVLDAYEQFIVDCSLNKRPQLV